MTPIDCTCSHCGVRFQVDDDAILDAVRILHQAGMEARVTCTACGRTVLLPPPGEPFLD
jgi:hypothetical protein